MQAPNVKTGIAEGRWEYGAAEIRPVETLVEGKEFATLAPLDRSAPL